MDEALSEIHKIEAEIEGVWGQMERRGRFSEALAAYQEAEARLVCLEMQPVGKTFRERERVLARCLLRQAATQRQFKRTQEASETGRQALNAARRSGHLLTLAEALMHNGADLIRSGDMEPGTHALNEARRLFASGESDQHLRGLAETWLLEAKLINVEYLPGGPQKALEAKKQAQRILKTIDASHPPLS